MNKHLLLLVLTLLLFAHPSNAQEPIQEVRGMWIASVANLDWPESNNLTVAEQKRSLDSLLSFLSLININTVFFQVRPECDALYYSEIEPWSYWLTGEQGKAPEPFYDPLEYAVKKAHEYGLELHAWLNPYRAVKKVGQYSLATNHVSVAHPEWVIQIGDFKFLNPGLPQVRDYVTSVVSDIVKRYDIDGIHFDDYFYPYTPNEITNQDSLTFIRYGRGIADINDWRRDNVNLLIAGTNEVIKKLKPIVRFGVSPFGIYRDNTPEGIRGYSSVDKIFCDPIAWINEKSVDYVAPQLYWEMEGPQNFVKLLKWWNEKAGSVEILPGLAVYKIESKGWGADELPGQIRTARQLENVGGTILFRAENLFYNPAGFTDSLRSSLYKQKALPTNFYSKSNTFIPQYAYYEMLGDSLIEINNLSNYTGKYAVFNEEGNLVNVSYNSGITIKGDSGDRLILKTVTRTNALNEKGLTLFITDENADYFLTEPKNGSLHKGPAITPELNINNGIRFYIVEVSSDEKFTGDLQISIINNGVPQQIEFKQSGKYFMKALVVDANGKLNRTPVVAFDVILE